MSSWGNNVNNFRIKNLLTEFRSSVIPAKNYPFRDYFTESSNSDCRFLILNILRIFPQDISILPSNNVFRYHQTILASINHRQASFSVVWLCRSTISQSINDSSECNPNSLSFWRDHWLDPLNLKYIENQIALLSMFKCNSCWILSSLR